MVKSDKKLLVVDDDHMMREFTERVLISLGHECVTAGDAASALLRLQDDADIRVLIIDIRLGCGPGGAQLAKDVLAIKPDLGIILTSGDPDALQTAKMKIKQNVEVLPKPYRRRDLAARLSVWL
ncbi:response regulator [Roseovarius sp. D0-M9]|uniref:response regulator n=1 Tax=Roseovarius sp. D0-M9 TaxID=3127117 RepID=UPI00300FAF12